MLRGNTTRGAQGGFVLFEVLVSIALLAFAGTSVLLICNSALRGQEDQLDRSVALSNLDALSKELLAFGANHAAQIYPFEDNLFRYELRAGNAVSGSSGFRAATVEAIPKGQQRGSITVELLLPASIVRPR